MAAQIPDPGCLISQTDTVVVICRQRRGESQHGCQQRQGENEWEAFCVWHANSLRVAAAASVLPAYA